MQDSPVFSTKPITEQIYHLCLFWALSACKGLSTVFMLCWFPFLSKLAQRLFDRLKTVHLSLDVMALSPWGFTQMVLQETMKSKTN